MSFSSWTEELARFKNALANMKETELLQSGYTDARGQTVTFKKFSDIHSHLDYLQKKADEESQTGGRRSAPFVAGFGGVG